MICDPIADEDVCVACAKDKCCSELEACEADNTCSCVIDCIGDPDTTDYEACLPQCGVGLIPTGPTLNVILCANNSCGTECPIDIGI
jgi:hypothetical protein